MDRSDWKDTPLLSQLEVLEVLDKQSRVLKATVLPNGAANTVSSCCRTKHCHHTFAMLLCSDGLLQAACSLTTRLPSCTPVHSIRCSVSVCRDGSVCFKAVQLANL